MQRYGKAIGFEPPRTKHNIQITVEGTRDYPRALILKTRSDGVWGFGGAAARGLKFGDFPALPLFCKRVGEAKRILLGGREKKLTAGKSYPLEIQGGMNRNWIGAATNACSFRRHCISTSPLHFCSLDFSCIACILCIFSPSGLDFRHRLLVNFISVGFENSLRTINLEFAHTADRHPENYA